MEHRFVLLEFHELPQEEMVKRAREFHEEMSRRRTVREFSDRPVPREIVEWAVRTAGTAPSGAHKQPWTFVLVGDPTIKARIRQAAETEEKESYEKRMPASWLADLEPLGTDWRKPFLTTCPWLLAVFAQMVGPPAPTPSKHYYVNESVGIAVGFLIAALHHAGLATLTHTPSPMGFLREILCRPASERPYVLLALGYPAEGCRVPDLKRKALDEILWVA